MSDSMGAKKTNLFRSQPKGLFYLFFAEMWERFSFYGLRALLMLYMTSELGYDDKRAFGVYAAYFTLVYLFTILGGVVADRFLGYVKAIIAGAVLITAGHLALVFSSIDTMFFYLGLGAIVSGTGLFKANISTLVGQLYTEGDKRRESGFTLFYIGINLGALMSPILCGLIGQKFGWHYGFGIASVGMLLGLITFVRGRSHLPKANSSISLGRSTIKGVSLESIVYALAMLSVPIATMFLYQHEIFEACLPFVAAGFLVYIVLLLLKYRGKERGALFTLFTLMLFQVGFFAIFEQAGSSVSLFTDRDVDRTVFGYLVPSASFLSVNSIFIIFLGPLFAGLWPYLAKKNLDPSPAHKFALALLQVGLGFFCFYWGAGHPNELGQCRLGWLILGYFFHTTGELCIMPVGLALVTRMAPKEILGTVMGIWFVSLAFSEYLAGMFAKLASIEPGSLSDGMASRLIYADAFAFGMKFAFALGLVLFVLAPLMRKSLTHRSS